MPAEVHVVIITFRPEELEAVLRRFPDRDSFRAGSRWYDLAAVDSDAGRRQVAIIRSPERGTGEAQALTEDILSEFKPQWLIVTGMAGGRPDAAFSLGDVVLSTHIHDLTVHAVSAGRPDTYSIKGVPLHTDVTAYVAHLSPEASALRGWNESAEISVTPPLLDFSNLTLYGSDDWKREVEASLRANFERICLPPSGDA